MTHLIIRVKTYTDNSKFYSIHDQTDNMDMALDKVRGYTLANSEKDIHFTLSEVQEPLLLTKDMVVKQDKHFDYNQDKDGQLSWAF